MQVNYENRAIVARTSKWATLVALLKSFVGYANDYLAGEKYKRVAHLKQEKENTK